ncbi:SRPBCC family protein [Novosphingobium sp. BL-52-GroH]|uniref:aromatic ring-hydroxylating oxygenase subunit alpha n=1 Tax=Novosphingobium sp. BL-52-GroH TaxID=3349877 RepID=UPI00385144A1
MSETSIQEPSVAGRVTDGQFRLLSAMPALSDCKYPEVRDTIPARVYTDPARYEAEVARIFRAGPTIAAPSALLPEPNTYHQVKIAGMPVLLTRNKAGKVKAFANVCRHRGMKLCTSERTEKAPRIVCPYHAWTYNLDGALVGLPRSETFPGLAKSELGLLELPCADAGGLIWVGLDADNPPDFSGVTGELAQDLDALQMGDAFLYDHATFPVKANWKLVMDSMLDSYHVTRLHKDSLAQFSVDSENQIDRIGLHIRNAAHRSNFDPALVSRDHDAMRRMMVFSYIGFPNGIIVVSPGYVSLGVVRPIAVDETAVDYYMLAQEKPQTEKAEGRLRRSMELMARVFGEEDYWAAAMCHEGIASGAISQVNLGGMEVQIRMFQDAVTDRLGEI